MRVTLPPFRLDDLLAPEGQAFVENAYRLLLGRAVDPSGERYYTSLLREGWSKWHVLKLLYRCDECRQQGLDLPGLEAELMRYTRAQLRTPAGWYRRSVLGVESDLPHDRHLRAMQQGVLPGGGRPPIWPGDEAPTWQRVRSLAPGGNDLAPAWAGRAFAAAVSLGCFCHAAEVLRRLDMRAGAGPFDWLFMNPGAVAHALGDGFARFLDPSQLQVVAQKDKIDASANVCEHLFYRNGFGVRFMFNHHNPTQDKDRAYFTRGVARLQAQLLSAAQGGRASAAPLLLLMMGYEPVTQAQVAGLRAALGQAAGGCFLLVVRLRVVGPDRDQPGGLFGVSHASPDHAAVELAVMARCDGVRFPHDCDNLALSDLLNAFSVKRHRRLANGLNKGVPG